MGKYSSDILFKKSHFQVEIHSADVIFQEVLELRNSCFGRVPFVPRVYDTQAKYLIVRDLDSKKICGVYRLSFSSLVFRFEAQDDFNIDTILQRSGEKLELAWACIHPDYRDGLVIGLLWAGISEIIKKYQINTVFGVTSLFIKENQFDFFSVTQYLSSKNNKSEFRREIPALLRAYLRAGAEIWPNPFWDEANQCYDFMTVWNIETSNASLRKHYSLDI